MKKASKAQAAARIGAVCYFIWGILHLQAAYNVIALADEFDSGMVQEPDCHADHIAGAGIFPEDAIVAIPTERRLSTAVFLAGLFASHAASVVNAPPPKLRFTDEIS